MTGWLKRLRGGRAEGEGDGTARSIRLFEQGKAYFDQGRMREARAAFEQVVRLTPDVPNAQFLLGVSRLQLGDTAAAVGPLERAVQMRPEHADATNALGMALGRLGQHDKADTYIARAAHLGHPQAPQTLAAMDMDYCRRCGAPVHYGHSNDPDADIVIITPEIGWSCDACGTVLCHGCAGVSPSIMAKSPSCPSCRGTLRAMTTGRRQ